MDFRHFKFLVALMLAERIWSLPLGCRYNGTSYKEGESVEVEEPCLSCACRSGGLSCSLRVCADYLETLPAGCFLVHRARDCCPQLLCEGGFGPNGVELRTAIETRNKVDGNGCVINGTVYGEGSAVASRDRCEYCYCAEGGLRCVRPRCVRAFEGCKAVHEEFSCCPTRFDCRDAKVSFLTSGVKFFVSENSDSEILTDYSPTSADADSEHFKANQSDESVSGSKEKTTEDFVTAATEETTTEGTTLGAQAETTTPPGTDSPTTLGFQTTDARSSENESSSGVGSTAETTPEVTTESSPASKDEDETENEGAEEKTEERGEERGEEEAEEPSGGEGRSPGDATEAVESRWNSSQIADDYDSYDYGEPKLPPSLPNLVIFPFVAADAVVKDETAELFEGAQVERVDDRPVTYKDLFSPPTKTEGGFVPKEPSSDPFYELPFLMKKPAVPAAEEKQTALQMIAQQQTHNEPSSSGDDRLTAEGYLTGDSKKSPGSPEETTHSFEFNLKSQQTKKPVTVTYKNVVVDFYPDHLVTTTRSHSTTRPAANPITDEPHQPHPTNTSTAVPFKMTSESLFEFFNEDVTSFPESSEQELSAEETSFGAKETASTTTTKEPNFFEEFLKTFLSEAHTPEVSGVSGTQHKYSSKIKGFGSTTAKPKREDGTATVDPQEVDTVTSPTEAHPPPDSFPGTDEPPQVLRLTEKTEPFSRDSVGAGDPESTGDGSDAGEPPKTDSHLGTLLKLAGCNIYGMMYRIGKVITELSGPCVECLCTDFGVQCSPLPC